jgi:hypothetical protein
MLRFITKDNNLYISNNYLIEVILNKSINLNILYYYILERIAYITY